MNVPAVFFAAFGLGLTIFAAMETEPEDIRRRAAFGIAGLVLLIWGVTLI